MRQPRTIKTWSVRTGLKAIGVVLILQLQFGLARNPADLLKLLNELPEPNYIEQADIKRINDNHTINANPPSSSLDGDRLGSDLIVNKNGENEDGSSDNLSSSPDDAAEPRHLASDDVDWANVYRPTLRTAIGERWAMSQIAWSSHNRMTFLSEKGNGFQVFIMVNSMSSESWLWYAVLSKITQSLKRLCSNDVINCKDQVFAGHLALITAYNTALSIADDNSSFIFTLALKDAQQSQNLLHVRRGILLRYEPMSLNVTPSEGDTEEQKIAYEKAIFEQTSILKERPKNADDIAFLTITTDLWDNVYMTRDLKLYMCQKYSESMNPSQSASSDNVKTDTNESSAGNLELPVDELDVTKNITLDATYWYARRFLIPPNNERILSSSVFVFLLKSLSEICSSDVATVSGPSDNNNNNNSNNNNNDNSSNVELDDGKPTTLASIIMEASSEGAVV